MLRKTLFKYKNKMKWETYLVRVEDEEAWLEWVTLQQMKYNVMSDLE